MSSTLLNFITTKDSFIKLQDEFIHSIKNVNEVNWGWCKIKSPASKFIKLKLGEAYLLLAVHERRHLWQAEQILKSF